MLIKLRTPNREARSAVREFAEIFRGRIVDVGDAEVIVEISGSESKVQAFVDRMRAFEIVELVRTGRIAMVRSSAPGHRAQDNANNGDD